MLTPKHSGNDYYEELCALAAIGELSQSEFEDLQRHLAECGDCRELHAEFRRLAADDLGLVAVRKRLDYTAQEAIGTLDENALLSKLFDRAQREHRAGPKIGKPEVQDEKKESRIGVAWFSNWFLRPVQVYVAVVLLLCAVAAMGAYRVRDAQVSPLLAQLRSQLDDSRGQAQATTAAEKSTSQLLQQSESKREELQKSLTEANAKYAAGEAEKSILESQLSAALARTDQSSQELQAARSGAEQKDARLAQLEARLDAAARRADEQQRTAADLRNELALAEASATAPATPEAGDAEAKNLFGARDLHIVDVYDVNVNGQTKRTYGRVYYVEKKLLVFYAFDLENKRRNRAASFQAWGYRQANQSKPDNLGLFNLDDSSLNRWVLKVNNLRVLEHIDAVFVTLEPPNGNTSPQGRRLLYANLAGPANHP